MYPFNPQHSVRSRLATAIITNQRTSGTLLASHTGLAATRKKTAPTNISTSMASNSQHMHKYTTQDTITSQESTSPPQSQSSSDSEYRDCGLLGSDIEGQLVYLVRDLVTTKIEAELLQAIVAVVEEMLPEFQKMSGDIALREEAASPEAGDFENVDRNKAESANKKSYTSTKEAETEETLLERCVRKVLKGLVDRLELILALDEWEKIQL
ncbi:hypothetical protein BX600DRAFT_530104 [Xylariales sp. PMI_506]|nr:hypothetical protein BX600DRAFT_530104 [Xylariales sp. PMI_506]